MILVTMVRYPYEKTFIKPKTSHSVNLKLLNSTKDYISFLTGKVLLVINILSEVLEERVDELNFCSIRPLIRSPCFFSHLLALTLLISFYKAEVSLNCFWVHQGLNWQLNYCSLDQGFFKPPLAALFLPRNAVWEIAARNNLRVITQVISNSFLIVELSKAFYCYQNFVTSHLAREFSEGFICRT